MNLEKIGIFSKTSKTPKPKMTPQPLVTNQDLKNPIPLRYLRKKRPQTTRNLAYQFNLINDESMTEKNETTTDNKPDHLSKFKSCISSTINDLDSTENLMATWYPLETTSPRVSWLKESMSGENQKNSKLTPTIHY